MLLVTRWGAEMKIIESPNYLKELLTMAVAYNCNLHCENI